MKVTACLILSTLAFIMVGFHFGKHSDEKPSDSTTIIVTFIVGAFALYAAVVE